MKKIITCLSLLSVTIASYSQSSSCQVTASASSQVVCLGDPVTISATASATLPANQFFNFNQNALPQGWGTTGGTNYNTNICGQSPDATPYFWASTVTSGLPQIVTANFDICSGGNLQFQMKYAIQGGSVPCEGPDLAHEGVSIEYSLNSGATWVEFRYYRPDGVILNANPMTSGSVASGVTPFTSWQTYTVPIPAAAISGSTRFRWIQKISSGSCCDNWGLDNIGILAGPCLQTNLEWSNGVSGVGNFTFTPTDDTCFTASLYDNNNNFLCASSPVCIQVAQNYTASDSATLCYGETYTLGSTVLNATGTYTETLSTVLGCDSVVTFDLTILPQITHSFNADICNGETLNLGTQTLSTTGSYQEVFTAIDGCDSTVTVNLTVFPVYSATKDTSFCDGYVFHFGGQSFTTGGSFPIMFSSIHGCDSLVTVNINLLPAPVPVAGNDLVLCSDELGILGGAPIANAIYSWSGGNGLSNTGISQPTVSINSLVPQVITYVVSSDYLGCIATDSVNVVIVPYPIVNITPVAAQCHDGNLFNFNPGNSFLQTTTFAWTIPQSNTPATIDQNPSSVHFLAAGTHQISVTASNGSCSTSGTMDVTVHAEPAASLTPLPPSGCIPLTVLFQNTSTPATVSSQWSFGNGLTSSLTSPSTLYSVDGTYTVSLVVTSTEGCLDTVIYNSLITAFPLPTAGFSPNPDLVFQDEPYIEVNDNSVEATAWAYTVSSGGYYETQNFIHQFYDTGFHYIHQLVTNQYGCTDEATHTVHVSPATSLFVPNAFTPNNDDINTYFGAYGNYVRDFHILIYDRWGIKVFESRDMNEHWDGTINGNLIKSDTYVYKISFIDHRGDTKEQLGHVTMMR